MALNLTVTRLQVDTHEQAEALHLLHQAAVVLRVALHNNVDVSDEERQRLQQWRDALHNHADAADLVDLPNKADLILAALTADFLRVIIGEPDDSPGELDES